NYCTYCIVPYVRGRERSIPVHLLIAEINRLKHKGYREVTLLGQNVNSYSNDDVDFALLLDRIAETGIEWIRFLTSHPVDLNERILEVMARRKNVCRHLHLPLQSGSDRILASMNRRYTTADYLTLVEKARHIVDGISLSTDFIFGFPGETEEDYQKSLSVINTVEFDYAFLYRYSERNGTKACGLEGSVPEKIRLERLKEAIERQRAISYKLNRKRIGEVHKVLVKEISKDGEGLFGLAEKNIPVVINGKTDGIKFGSFVDVRIESTTGSSLIGIVE
ncbi:MAG: MiaB/RimO family radical SAM methylthiotransferase, partial [Candidatus Latescibacteria bacterium]|nr:MiaB/RimO family radical SAM methylthiotransferase [Candidatus Latescibacterota bacterium]